MEIEFHQIESRYKELRILDPRMQSKLIASLSKEGQKTPVFVVEPSAGKYVLIDGYKRISALTHLGRDTVKAQVLDMKEVDALIEYIKSLQD